VRQGEARQPMVAIGINADARRRSHSRCRHRLMSKDHAFGEPSRTRGRHHQGIAAQTGNGTVTARFTLRGNDGCGAKGIEELQLGLGGEALIDRKNYVTGIPDALQVLNKGRARGKIEGNESTSHGTIHPTDATPQGRDLSRVC
jgi:hypothetical protein